MESNVMSTEYVVGFSGSHLKKHNDAESDAPWPPKNCLLVCQHFPNEISAEEAVWGALQSKSIKDDI